MEDENILKNKNKKKIDKKVKRKRHHNNDSDDSSSNKVKEAPKIPNKSKKRHDSSDESEDSDAIKFRRRKLNSDDNSKESSIVNDIDISLNSKDDISHPINTSKVEGDSQLSTKDFFAKLMLKEINQPRIGTVHHIGKKADGVSERSSNDWLCPKCGTSNFRQSIQCTKCRCLKKITEWR